MTNRTMDRPMDNPIGHAMEGPAEHFVAEERRHEMLASAARVRLVAGLSPEARHDTPLRRLRYWVGRVTGGGS